MRLGSALALSLLLAACSPDSKRAQHTLAETCMDSANTSGIVGGQNLPLGTDLSSSTVLIIHIESSGEESLCTGTLIDNNKVLTAAHCTSKSGKNYIAFTDNVACAAALPSQFLRPVTKKLVHKDYVDSNNTQAAATDIAILKFSGSMKNGYKVRPLPTSDNIKVQENGRLVAAGFGVTSENREDSGTLRYVETDLLKLSDSYIRAVDGRRISVKKTIILSQEEKGVCLGDSGGPLYIEDSSGLHLIGVTSMVTDNLAQLDTPLEERKYCHGVAIFVSVLDHLDWIREGLRNLDAAQRSY